MNSVSVDGESRSPMGLSTAAATLAEGAVAATDIKFCAIDDPGCEACQ